MASIEMPDDLADDVAEVWRSTLEQLDIMELASPSDADSLRCYCEAVVLHRKASLVLAKSPILVKGLHGPVRNPALQVQREAALTIKTFAQEFGLTPLSRQSLKSSRESEPVVEPVKETPVVPTLDEIAKRRNVRKFGA